MRFVAEALTCSRRVSSSLKDLCLIQDDLSILLDAVEFFLNQVSREVVERVGKLVDTVDSILEEEVSGMSDCNSKYTP